MCLLHLSCHCEYSQFHSQEHTQHDTHEWLITTHLSEVENAKSKIIVTLSRNHIFVLWCFFSSDKLCFCTPKNPFICIALHLKSIIFVEYMHVSNCEVFIKISFLWKKLVRNKNIKHNIVHIFAMHYKCRH